MTKLVGLRAKTYSYLIDKKAKDKKDKKAKDTKRCAIKRKIKFENYKNCFHTTELENKTKYLEGNKVNIDSLKKT